jgi:hypothetical protein
MVSSEPREGGSMMGVGYDAEELLLVAVAGLPPTPDADYAHLVATFDRLGADACRRCLPGIMVIVADRDSNVPSATWRQRIAESHKRWHRPLRIALVTDSAIIRGVSTALRWMSGSRSTMTRSTHSVLAEAVDVLERETGRRLPRIQELHDSVRGAMAATRRARGHLVRSER